MISRTVYLGEEVRATASFFNNGIVIPSRDPSLYPYYTVRDTNQELIAGGVGTLSTDNLYHCTFFIPEHALLSTDVAKYVIEWELISPTNESFVSTEYFDVIHPTYDNIVKKEIQKITLPMTPLVLNIPLPDDPDTITFTVYNEYNVSQFTVMPQSTGLYSGFYIYTVTIPPNTFGNNRTYLGVWTFTIDNVESVYVQKINIIDMFTMSRISDMRMYIDKVCKDVDLYVGYRDSDLVFHFQQGLNIVNTMPLITEWKPTDFINYSGLAPAIYGLTMAACLSALRAEYLAEGDNAFDYSGQPVSLTVDRTQYIESEIGRIQEYLTSEFAAFKKQFIRRQYGVNLGLAFPGVNNNLGYGMDQRRIGIPLNIPMSK